MNFLLVDKDTWDCAEILSKDEIKEELSMNDTQFYNFLERGSLFRDQYYLVEDEYSMPKKKKPEILYERIDESDCNIWYISNQGTIIAKNKNTKKVKELSMYVNVRGEVAVRANGKTYEVKNLVAQHFIRTWSEGCIVKVIDPTKPITPENLSLEPRKMFFKRLQNDRVSRSVGEFKGNQCVRTWTSITACAKDLLIDKSYLAKLLNKNELDNIRFI